MHQKQSKTDICYIKIKEILTEIITYFKKNTLILISLY